MKWAPRRWWLGKYFINQEDHLSSIVSVLRQAEHLWEAWLGPLQGKEKSLHSGGLAYLLGRVIILGRREPKGLGRCCSGEGFPKAWIQFAVSLGPPCQCVALSSSSTWYSSLCGDGLSWAMSTLQPAYPMGTCCRTQGSPGTVEGPSHKAH